MRSQLQPGLPGGLRSAKCLELRCAPPNKQKLSYCNQGSLVKLYLNTYYPINDEQIFNKIPSLFWFMNKITKARNAFSYDLYVCMIFLIYDGLEQKCQVHAHFALSYEIQFQVYQSLGPFRCYHVLSTFSCIRKNYTEEDLS